MSADTPRFSVQSGVAALSEDLPAIARGLLQFDASDDFARMLSSLVRASHEFVGVADLEGNALFVNEAGRKLVGLTDLDAVHATRIIDYFAPEDRDRVLHEVMPAARDNGFWEGELKFRNFATGETIPVLYNIFPVRGASDAIVAYGTVTRNLSDGKLADERAHWLGSIVELSDDAVVSKNLDGIIASWNKGAERVFGYTAEEAIGRPITIVIPEDRQNEEVEISKPDSARRAYRSFRDHSAAQGRHLVSDFADRLTGQKRRGPNYRRLEDRAGCHRAKTKPGTNRDAGPRG